MLALPWHHFIMRRPGSLPLARTRIHPLHQRCPSLRCSLLNLEQHVSICFYSLGYATVLSRICCDIPSSSSDCARCLESGVQRTVSSRAAVAAVRRLSALYLILRLAIAHIISPGAVYETFPLRLVLLSTPSHDRALPRMGPCHGPRRCPQVLIFLHLRVWHAIELVILTHH